jgi:hypothetical protein
MTGFKLKIIAQHKVRWRRHCADGYRLFYDRLWVEEADK